MMFHPRLTPPASLAPREANTNPKSENTIGDKIHFPWFLGTYLVIASLPVALAPYVVILHGEASEGWTILVHQHLAEFEE